MNKLCKCGFGRAAALWGGLHLGLVFLGLSLGLAGCQGQSATSRPETEVLEREGERLRREHQKEMYNK